MRQSLTKHPSKQKKWSAYWLIGQKVKFEVFVSDWDHGFESAHRCCLLTVLYEPKTHAPGVPCILFEGKSKECNLLVSHCVKQAIHNSICKPPPLIFIHCNHLVPVVCNFRQVQSLGKVHKIENVLLEAASTKSY